LYYIASTAVRVKARVARSQAHPHGCSHGSCPASVPALCLHHNSQALHRGYIHQRAPRARRVSLWRLQVTGRWGS